MEFEKEVFEYNGVKTVYYAAGEGVPLLFFHGGGGWALVYEDMLKELAKDFLVVAPDLPCFGGSDVLSEPWGFSDYANYFSEFVKFLNLEDVVVVGHSFGGGVALHLAGNCDRVKKLVLINSLGIPLECDFRDLLLRVTQDFAKSYEDIIKKQPESDLLRVWFKSNAPGVFEKLKTARKCVETAPPTFDGYSKPTLVLWGEGDEVLPLYYGKKVTAAIPGAVLKIIPAKHKSCIFEPQIFVRHIREFYSKD